MAANTSIEWCHHTFNPWMGCTKVSAGCANCYAETLMDTRYGKTKWGPRGLRVIKADSGWREPLKWDREAKAAGERHRVFCASLADVFEGEDTMPADAWPAVEEARTRLFALIDGTPNLDWLLLTKRPENAARMIRKTPWDRCAKCGAYADLDEEEKRESLFKLDRHNDGWVCRKCGIHASYHRENLWLGTSVENEDATCRIDILRRSPVVVRFLSIEPLIGPIGQLNLAGIHWVIVGGESGHGARPMNVEWARSIVSQCKAAGVECFVKQLGAEPRDPPAGAFDWENEAHAMLLKDPKGGDWSEWPEDLRVREFPQLR
jgi:protein gp37